MDESLEGFATPQDVEEFHQALDVGTLEFFGDEQITNKQCVVSGRRVLVRLKTRPESPYGFRIGDLLIVEVIDALRVAGLCRACGCSDDNACEGGCGWVEPDLCSRCAPNEQAQTSLHVPTGEEVAAVLGSRMGDRVPINEARARK
jgi:hypothetical protein